MHAGVSILLFDTILLFLLYWNEDFSYDYILIKWMQVHSPFSWVITNNWVGSIQNYCALQVSRWASGPDDWLFSSGCGIWLLSIMALPVFSTDQLSPADTDSSRTFARLCRRYFVLHKYLLFMSFIRQRLAHEQHLWTYPSSDGNMRLMVTICFALMEPGRSYISK